jgi:hypothetical protein
MKSTEWNILDWMWWHTGSRVSFVNISTVVTMHRSARSIWKAYFDNLRLGCMLFPHLGNWLTLMMITSMGRNYVSELRPPTDILFIPRWYMSMENHGWMLSTGENSWFVHQSSLPIIQAEPSSSKSLGTWRRKLWIWTWGQRLNFPSEARRRV